MPNAMVLLWVEELPPPSPAPVPALLCWSSCVCSWGQDGCTDEPMSHRLIVGDDTSPAYLPALTFIPSSAIGSEYGSVEF